MEPAGKRDLICGSFFLAWILLTCLLSLTPHVGVNLERGSDKIAHFIFYIPFGAIGFFLSRQSLRRILLICLFGFNLGLLLELLQRHVPGRSCDAKDFLADALGVAAGLTALGGWRLFSKRRN